MRILLQPAILFTGLILGTFAAYGDQPCPSDGCDPALLARRSLDAAPISGAPPVVDGRLDEPAWSQAPVATGFTQNRPRPGAPSSLRSEARVLVDGEAIYVGLTYFDPEPAKIQAPLARRDDETISDWSFVEIDSRYDRRSIAVTSTRTPGAGARETASTTVPTRRAFFRRATVRPIGFPRSFVSPSA